jgi:serine/threonine protein phosphatase PrpC
MKAVADKNPEPKNPLMKVLGEESKGESNDGGQEERTEESYMLDSKGCTANVVLIKGKEIYCSNAGDSRCVLSREGKAVDLSKDHKPEDEIEKNRITNAGSEITDGRVDGNLNLSRSLGDLKHKQKPDLTPEEQPITSNPDITVTQITAGDEFIVMA